MSSLDKPDKRNQTEKRLLLTPEVANKIVSLLSEKEILGLDEPKFSVRKGEQELKVPKAVKHLYESQSLELAEALLSRFGLNSKIYNEAENPRGLMLQDIPASPKGGFRRAFYADLRLLGVRTEEINGFFGLNLTASKELSPAFLKAQDFYNHQRETYAFRHREEFHAVDSLLIEIARLMDVDSQELKPEDLFNRGQFPEIFEWRGRGGRLPSFRKTAEKFTLPQALRVISLSLRTKTKPSEIARAMNCRPETVTRFLTTNSCSRRSSLLT